MPPVSFSMRREKRSQVCRGAWLAVVFALVLATAGCSRRDGGEKPHVELTEPGFAAQAEAVRQGRSDAIRLDHTLVRDEQLDELDGLEDKLRRLNLSQTHISDAGLARIAGMRKLEQLRLASDRVTDAGLARLVDLKELRHLHLIGMPISDEGLTHLHALAGLESLYLDGTKATDEGMARLVEALPLVHLHFDGGHHRGDPHAANHKHE
jgi:Leucine Rich repeat